MIIVSSTIVGWNVSQLGQLLAAVEASKLPELVGNKKQKQLCKLGTTWTVWVSLGASVVTPVVTFGEWVPL